MHPPPPPFYETAIFWLYVAVWLPFTLFVACYATRSPWRDTAAGRGLMTVSAVTVAILSNTLFTVIFGDYELRDAVRAVLLGAASAAGWYQLKNLLVLQQDGRRVRHDAACEPTPAPAHTPEETP